MAEVWYAENEIGKKAAVKVLLPKFCADEAIVARFQNEAKVNDGARHHSAVSAATESRIVIPIRGAFDKLWHMEI